jgi:hypothetical protein
MKAALLAITAGCGFSSSSSGGDDTSELCPFPLTAEYTDPCTATPSNLDSLPDVSIGGAAQVDSTNGEITGPGLPASPPTTMANGVRIVWAKDFTITSAGSLRAYGPAPLMIVATGDIRISGEIDASSSMFAAGPGANPPACVGDNAAKPGETCAQHGGSGGGGGGFGAAGGAGGLGGETRDCGGGVLGRPGGAGGTALAMTPTELRGGCPGANGAPTNSATSVGGASGSGGGAIALVARGKIIITATGRVHAGGGGGSTGEERAGGGGGGSGGMIFLEAPDIDLQVSSVLAANGGGGGAGTDNGEPTAGEDGWPSTDAAKGGAPDSGGGAGGDGGVITVEQGRPGGLAQRGGGGGGGGVGVIRLHEMTSMRAGVTTPAIAD